MKTDDGLVFGCLLDGRGGARFGGWELAKEDHPEGTTLWLHLDLRSENARTWVREESGLDEIAGAALLARESRPRSVARGETLLVNLRGVNLTPGAEPHDMVAVRVELEGNRIITTRKRKLRALNDVRKGLEAGHGPRDTGEFLVDLIDRLLLRMGAAFEDLDTRIDQVQERVSTEGGSALRAEIAEIRNQVISMRRYLAPQREAVARLQSEKVRWLTPLHREQLRDLADRTMRRVEDLEAARDRSTVAYEELTGRLAEQMNRTMYVIALVTAIFLPLGLITGLLGINVGGMPGAENDLAFWMVCGLLVALALGQWWWFRKHRLF